MVKRKYIIGLLIPSRVIYVGRSNTCGSKRIIQYDALERTWTEGGEGV